MGRYLVFSLVLGLGRSYFNNVVNSFESVDKLHANKMYTVKGIAGNSHDRNDSMGLG